jgi:hypothetical protein
LPPAALNERGLFLILANIALRQSPNDSWRSTHTLDSTCCNRFDNAQQSDSPLCFDTHSRKTCQHPQSQSNLVDIGQIHAGCLVNAIALASLWHGRFVRNCHFNV